MVNFISSAAAAVYFEAEGDEAMPVLSASELFAALSEPAEWRMVCEEEAEIYIRERNAGWDAFESVDTTPGPLAAGVDVSCSECGAVLVAGEIVENVPVPDWDGTLDYIEIRHAGRSCRAAA